MLNKLDDAKADLLDRAAHAAAPSGDGADADFLHRYYRRVAPEDLVGRDPVDVAGAAYSHRELARNRPQGVARVRVFTPTVESNGWSCGHAVVEVVTDDMPFLVDSVSGELAQQGRAIHLVVHPQLVVHRTITGELLDVLDDAVDGRPAEATLESWIHVEIDRVTDAAELSHIEEALRRVLSDVRESVEDWAKMRAAAARVAESLTEEPPTGGAGRRGR